MPTLIGSSPRGRGIHGHGRRRLRRKRFIPAWAGNTAGGIEVCSLDAVHPRVGGEYAAKSIRHVNDRGSSPRGRGIPFWRLASPAQRRFIPAWAGNTADRLGSGHRPAVHPRVGGEYATLKPSMRSHFGSSPRGRGIPVVRRGRLPGSRFIPAWAGNTRHGPLHMPVASVHPRVGGEYQALDPQAHRLGGSSPRGRGIPGGSSWNQQKRRFIPAWAGNTVTHIRLSFLWAVHPRVGGEYHHSAGRGGAGPGSSPRGRGIR